MIALLKRATPRPRTGRRPHLAAALGLVAVLLAGCASIPPAPPWQPPAPAAPALSVTHGQPAPATPAASEPSASDPAAPDPAAAPTSPSAPGLDVRLLYNADPASPVAARWGEIPGNPTFTTLLRDRVRSAVADHAAATGVPYAPAADAPTLAPDARGCVAGSTTRPAAELVADPAFTPPGGGPSLTITCEVLAAAGTILVQALRVTTASGGTVTADSTTVYYVETGGAFITTSDTLVSDDGLRMLLTDVVQSLKVAAGAMRPEMVQSVDDFPVETLRADFAHFSFAADGSLVVSLPAGFTTPELDAIGGAPAAGDSLFVTVPAATATGMLSAEGAQIQSVLASGTPFTVPAAPWRGLEDVDCGFFACVALTFDDGPGEYTEGVLDELDARRAAASFFVQGYRVVQNPSVLERMTAEGHEIGNHTWNHPDLTKLTDPEIKDQLDRAGIAIKQASGHWPTSFRPPYGAVDDRVLKQTDLPAILWSNDTNDWQLPDDATLLDRAVGQPDPGAIILMHDVHENTARMVPQVLDGLLGRGFTLVTVQQVLGGSLPGAHSITR